jgi:hypothetical protein
MLLPSNSGPCFHLLKAEVKIVHIGAKYIKLTAYGRGPAMEKFKFLFGRHVLPMRPLPRLSIHNDLLLNYAVF